MGRQASDRNENENAEDTKKGIKFEKNLQYFISKGEHKLIHIEQQ